MVGSGSRTESGSGKFNRIRIRNNANSHGIYRTCRRCMLYQRKEEYCILYSIKPAKQLLITYRVVALLCQGWEKHSWRSALRWPLSSGSALRWPLSSGSNIQKIAPEIRNKKLIHVQVTQQNLGLKID